ncbi:MAG: hypothetical protein ACTSYF_09985 [Promethearchaeota archaeon]
MKIKKKKNLVWLTILPLLLILIFDFSYFLPKSHYHIRNLQLKGKNATSYWIYNGTVISNASGAQGASTTLIDNNGNILVVWADTRKDGGDIYLQKMSENGKNLWTFNGIPIYNDDNVSGYPKMVLDANGGVVITWQDNRTGKNEVYVQRVDNQGQLTWEPAGKKAVVTSSLQEDPLIVRTTDGNFSVIWEDNRSAITGKDLYAQKFNLNGDKQWAPNGTCIVNATGDQLHYRTYQSLVAAEQGGIVVSWRDQRIDTGDIYAQKLNQDGVPQWDDNGTAICTEGDRQRYSIVNAIDEDYFLILWRDERNSGSLGRDLYMQKLNSSGEAQWTGNGTIITNALNHQQDHDLTINNEDEIFIIWDDERVDASADIYMQKVNGSGHSQWKENGTIISNETGIEVDPEIVISGGNLFVVWEDKVSFPQKISLMKYDLNGNKLWTSKKSVVNVTNTIQIYDVISDGNGGLIITWWDNRDDVINGDLYMLRLNSSGGLWIPSPANGPPPPDNWWFIILTITLSITIPAGIGASLAALLIMRRRRRPEVRIPPKKVLLSEKLTDEEEKTLKCILKFFSFIYSKKN